MISFALHGICHVPHSRQPLHAQEKAWPFGDLPEYEDLGAEFVQPTLIDAESGGEVPCHTRNPAPLEMTIRAPTTGYPSHVLGRQIATQLPLDFTLL